MKKAKIIFWVATTLIFLLEGVVPALTSQSAMTIQGFTHLGYPVYFATLLTIFKVLGACALMIPFVPSRIKEWAYAGFAFDFLCAFVSICAVDGFSGIAVLPIVAIVILVISYTQYHNIQSLSAQPN